MAVGDRHLVEADALACPVEALAGDLAHLARWVGGGEELQGVVGGGGLGGDREEMAAGGGECRLGLIGFVELLVARAGVEQRRSQVEVGGVSVLGRGCGQEDRDREPLAELSKGLGELCARLPEAVDEQGLPRSALGLGRQQAVVRPVEALAALEELGEDLPDRLLLSRDLAGALDGLLQGGAVIAGATQLADEAVQGVGEARRVAHGLEVVVASGGDLAQQDPIGERRQRPSPLHHERPLPEVHRQLARHDEADVGDPIVEDREAALEVGALQGPAEKDADWCERVLGLGAGNAPRERFLKRRR